MSAGLAGDYAVPYRVDGGREIEGNRPVVDRRAGVVHDGDLAVETRTPVRRCLVAYRRLTVCSANAASSNGATVSVRKAICFEILLVNLLPPCKRHRGLNPLTAAHFFDIG